MPIGLLFGILFAGLMALLVFLAGADDAWAGHL